MPYVLLTDRSFLSWVLVHELPIDGIPAFPDVGDCDVLKIAVVRFLRIVVAVAKFDCLKYVYCLLKKEPSSISFLKILRLSVTYLLKY